MSIEVPANSRGPILNLTLPASEDPIDIVLRNQTTGKQLTVNLPEEWDGTDLELDFFRRTIKDASGADRSALLDPVDDELWRPEPLVPGSNDIEITVRPLRLDFISGSALGAIAVDATYVYWYNASLNIGRAKLDGTEANQNFLAAASEALGIAVNATHIYWAESLPDNIGRANIDGTGASSSFITAPSEPLGVALDDTYVYWVDGSIVNNIGRAKLDGTEVNNNFITEVASPSGGIVVSATHIYWATSNADIGRAKLDGTEVNNNFLETSHDPKGIALDGTYIYWADQEGGNIGRAKLDGTEVNNNFITDPSIPQDVKARGEAVYWSDLGSSSVSRWGGKEAYAAAAALRWEKGYY